MGASETELRSVDFLSRKRPDFRDGSAEHIQRTQELNIVAGFHLIGRQGALGFWQQRMSRR